MRLIARVRARLAEIAGSYFDYRNLAGGTRIGERPNGPVNLQLDRRLHPEFCGATIVSDAGLLTTRGLDDALLSRR